MLGKQALTVTPDRKEGQQYIIDEILLKRFKSIRLVTHRHSGDIKSATLVLVVCDTD
jgi:hypothetical protein